MFRQDRHKELLGRIEKLSAYLSDLTIELRFLKQDCATALEILGKKVEDGQQAYLKMADRLIEMAMVHRGDTRMAVSHRQQGRIESEHSSPPSTNSGPSNRPSEEEWPPPGHTVVGEVEW